MGPVLRGVSGHGLELLSLIWDYVLDAILCCTNSRPPSIAGLFLKVSHTERLFLAICGVLGTLAGKTTNSPAVFLGVSQQHYSAALRKQGLLEEIFA